MEASKQCNYSKRICIVIIQFSIELHDMFILDDTLSKTYTLFKLVYSSPYIKSHITHHNLRVKRSFFDYCALLVLRYLT
jgi:hypothetical protein